MKKRLNPHAMSPSRNFQDLSNGGKYPDFLLNQNNIEPSQNSFKNPMTSRKFANAGRMVLNQPQMKQLSQIKNAQSQQRPRPTTTVNSEVVHLISACVQGKAISIKSGTSKMSQVPRNNEQKYISPPSFQMYAMDDKTYKTTQFQGSNAFVPHVFPPQLNSHVPKRSSIQIISKAAKNSGENSKEFQPIHTIHPHFQPYQHLATQPHNQKYPTQQSIPQHLLEQQQYHNNEHDLIDMKSNLHKQYSKEGSQHKQEVENKEKEEEGVEMTLDQYFKVPTSQLPEEAQKLLLFSSDNVDSNNQNKISNENNDINCDSDEFNNQMQFLHPDLSEEGSSRAGISRGVVVFNEDNEEDFFGLGRLEELDIERFIEELKSDQKILTQDLSKCDLEDIKGHQLYSELIQELIKYIIRAVDLQKDKSQPEKQSDNIVLQYFLFNGIEDCIWWRELPEDILQIVSKNIQTFRLDLVETLGRRLEKKWYLIETPEKALLAVEILFNKFIQGLCESDSLMNSLVQAVKITYLRENIINMIKLLAEKEDIQTLRSTPKGLMLIMTLKALSADFTQILESKGFNLEEDVRKLAGNVKIEKLFKKLKTYF